MHTKLEPLDGWEIIKEDLSMWGILREIKKLGTKHDNTQYPRPGFYDTPKGIYTLRKDPETALATHLEQLQTRLEVAEEVASSIGTEEERVDALLRSNEATKPYKAYASNRATTERTTRDHFSSIIFL